MTEHGPMVLVLLDGFGWREEEKANAIALAKKPTIDYLLDHYPHALLQASGMAVGLPANTPGNSEVGHMALGAGRVIEQPITMLNKAIADGSFFSNPLLTHHLKSLEERGTRLHIIGLLSDGCVHSTYQHLYAYIQAALSAGVTSIIVHAILDGRDVSAQSAQTYLKQLDEVMRKHRQVKLGSVMGRYYAMDRDKNWDRTQKAYECLVTCAKPEYPGWPEVLQANYAQDITDEFIPPTPLDSSACIKQGDGVIFFNVRPDRARQLISALVSTHFEPFVTSPVSFAFFITPVSLNHWPQVTVLYPTYPIIQTLKEVLSTHGKSIFTIAESEKYAHVTYFFSGGHEQPFSHEERVLIPSIKAKNYIQQPCMSAPGITKAVIDSLRHAPCDFYLINYANADMVGHSGDLPATIKAVECLDEQIKKLYDYVVTQMNGTLFITGDHGNAEYKYDERLQLAHTAHTTSPVPFIWVNQQVKSSHKTLPLKGLADVAPFILKCMKLPIPVVMAQRQ